MRKPAQLSVLVLLAQLTLSACAPEPRSAAAEKSVSTVEAELRAVWTEYIAAVKAGDAGRIAALYADSVYFMESGAPTLRSREALHSFAREALAGVRILDASIIPEFTEIRGTDAGQYGRFVDLIEVPGQGTIRKYGRYAAIAERDSAGEWRIARLTALTDSAPAVVGVEPTEALRAE